LSLKSVSTHKALIFSALITSLFVYLFYRSDHTVVNAIFSFFFSSEFYSELKLSVSSSLQLPSFFIFSLPEGLWILAITLASKSLFISVNGKRIELSILPIVIAVFFEIIQFAGLTNGTFDWLDLLSAFCFWYIGYFLIPAASANRKLFQSFDFNTILCLSTYLIVFLAHVSQ